MSDAREERPITVEITDTATGETRTQTDVGFWSDGRFEDYVWEGGNFACDCNRGQFFAEAGGVDTDALPEEPDPFPCGDERYVVRITDEAGVEVYSDREDALTPAD